MASPQLHMRPEPPEYVGKQRRSALRLLGAERSEEMFPALLEEIVALGFPRAFVARVDFETSEITPVASLNCSKVLLQRFQTSLYAIENPLVRVLHGLEPELVSARNKRGPDLYFHPLVYRNKMACWEAERTRRDDCVAVENFHARRLQLQDQLCTICGMTAYAA